MTFRQILFFRKWLRGARFPLLSGQVVYNLTTTKLLRKVIIGAIVATLLTREEGEILIAYFQDVRIIDETRIQSLGLELNDLVGSSSTKNIILNFQNVSFMSSAMIGKLIQFGKKCKSSEVKLCLSNINENVEEVFTLMKLENVFNIEKDEEQAIASFAKKGWFK